MAKITNAEKILRYIQSSEEGRSWTEISKFIHEVILEKPGEWSRENRGTYGSNLYGANGDMGLLASFCENDKVTKKWKVVSVIGSPFYVSYIDWALNKNEIIQKRMASNIRRILSEI